MKNIILGKIKTVSIIAKVIDKDSINDLPSYTSQFSTSHLYPENQIPGKNIPANPVTVEKKLKKAVTPAL